MANKGPIKANRNTSHSTAVLIDVFSASLPLRNLPLCVSCSPPCMTHVRAPSICKRDFFLYRIRVHLGVPSGKRVIEIHHYQSH